MLMIPPRVRSRGLGQPSSLPHLNQAFRLDTTFDRRPVVPGRIAGHHHRAVAACHHRPGQFAAEPGRTPGDQPCGRILLPHLHSPLRAPGDSSSRSDTLPVGNGSRLGVSPASLRSLPSSQALGFDNEFRPAPTRRGRRSACSRWPFAPNERSKSAAPAPSARSTSTTSAGRAVTACSVSRWPPPLGPTGPSAPARQSNWGQVPLRPSAGCPACRQLRGGERGRRERPERRHSGGAVRARPAHQPKLGGSTGSE